MGLLRAFCSVKLHPTTPGRGLFHAIDRKRFGRTICFLCGCTLTARNRSNEHIVPKWVLRRFSLWDQRLRLLNGSYIPYRDLTIPCCRGCNGKHLRAVEDRVKAAMAKGPSAVAKLDPLTLFLWLGKIFYGMLYKERLLVRDRRSKTRATILDRRSLKAFALHHLFLQAARLPVKFVPAIPASIFVFRVAEPKDKRFKWDFRDSLALMTVACRVGNVGILAALHDGGAQRDTSQRYWRRYQKFALHPLQFTELSAVFFYAVSLLNRVPKFMMIEPPNGEVHVVQNALQGFSLKPILDDWNQEEFATTFLAPMLGVPLESVFQPPAGVATWLHDEKGRIHPQPVDGPECGRFG